MEEIPNLHQANLSSTDLRGANLIRANLYRAKLIKTNLNKTNLKGANLRGANLSEANLAGAILRKCKLSGADLRHADLRHAIFTGADLSGANLKNANLSNTDFSEANLSNANLSNANLSNANLTNANIMFVKMNNTTLQNAKLSGAYIYGISVWDVNLEGATQTGLIISPDEKKTTLTIDNLEVAQFVYLLLNNSKIRDIINTMTGKSVLLLGRFGNGRKAILDGMADWLRKEDMLPIIMDFEQPDNKDFTETVRTLAGLCKYVIADLTSPQSVPHEIAQIIPFLAIPFVPLIQEGKTEYSMLRDFYKHHWLLPIVHYQDHKNLISSMMEKIIEPAEKKHKEIEIRKKQLWA